MSVPPVIQLFPLHVVCLLNTNKISKGHIGSLWGTMLYIGFTDMGKGWLYSGCHIAICK